MSAVLLSLATLASTSAGGLCALCLRERLNAVLAFSGGALLGVACFHLLPECLELSRELGGSGEPALLALAAGLLLFHGLRRLAPGRRALDRGSPHAHHARFGLLSSAALVGHSFLDGVGIGVALQASPAAGLAFAIAVIAHDFCDGVNTVGMMLAHGNSAARAIAMLALDAIAPVLGVVSTQAYRVPPEALVAGLGVFAGLLLYIGAAVILPLVSTRAGAGAMRSLGLMGLGALLVYGLSRLVH